ncbi:5'-nucleotidase, lipoprotein e(P4) family [Helicovermis profundi]|uniref:5'-nucleotidase, lipoprotein e(P4) family n=1 Tax=Helicovermis profundi TaxID=3065157 RepID=A0AAU9EJI7_9FIRM|nr:5'-nucleotidase, lipoprotein e(P4) family [Clostridia bacterium S502]
MKRRILSLVMVLSLVVSIGAVSFANDNYSIQSGDTLANIASKTGVKVEDLVKFNDLKNPNMIYAGGVLKLAPDFSQVDLNEEYVMALAWVQNSGEFKALSYQAFNMAKMMIDLDLVNNASATMKGAVIVDADETVIDNSAFNASFVGNAGHYSSSSWGKWVNDEQALAMPGSAEFLNYAASKGYDIYYITNRKETAGLLEPTMNNLKALGFPQITKEHMMLRTAESSKEARRDMVAKDHRLVVLMGDNLNDFSNVFEKKNNAERSAEVAKLKADFGSKFIMLPNPIYGEWEPQLTSDFYWGLDAKGKSDARQNSLRKWNQQ